MSDYSIYAICVVLALCFWIYHVGYKAGTSEKFAELAEIRRSVSGLHSLLARQERKIDRLTNKKEPTNDQTV